MMLLEMASNAFGDRVAIGSKDGSGVSYTTLYENSGRAAQLFRNSSAEKIAFLNTSSIALPTALFGSAWAGLPFVPLNYRLTGDEIRELGTEIAPAIGVANVSMQDALKGVPEFEAIEREEFLSQIREGEPPDADWGMDPDQIAILLFTSGTTGAPKAAVLRHSHLVSYILGSVEFMGAGDEEATLVSVPPYLSLIHI